MSCAVAMPTPAPYRNSQAASTTPFAVVVLLHRVERWQVQPARAGTKDPSWEKARGIHVGLVRVFTVVGARTWATSERSRLRSHHEQ